MPELIAKWNSARGVWEKPETVNLFCEHLELYLETWPTSGTMRNGLVFERRMPGHLITGSASSSLPTLATPTTGETVGPSLSSSGGENLRTQVALMVGRDLDTPNALLRSPKASEGHGGALGEAEALRRGNTVGVRDQIMDLMAEQGLKVSRAERNDLLPTPTVSDQTGAAQSEIDEGNPHDRLKVEVQLPPTPVTTDHKQNDSPAAWNRHTQQMGTIVHSMEWGKFGPAIARWETVLGRQAPAPTKPDGKDGAHRLSSKFTEWMMGLPAGWITDVGLSRNEELKACGNGVVPQQAALALRVLLSGIDIERERENCNVPNAYGE